MTTCACNLQTSCTCSDSFGPPPSLTQPLPHSTSCLGRGLRRTPAARDSQPVGACLREHTEMHTASTTAEIQPFYRSISSKHHAYVDLLSVLPNPGVAIASAFALSWVIIVGLNANIESAKSLAKRFVREIPDWVEQYKGNEGSDILSGPGAFEDESDEFSIVYGLPLQHTIMLTAITALLL